MARHTIDASAALAYLLDEPRPDWVDEALTRDGAGRFSLVAPALIWLEIGNCLARIGDMTDEFALEAMLRAEALGVDVIEIDRPIRLRALTLAREHGLTMYDATYLAVSEAAHAPLLTLDRRLEQAARSMGLGREGGNCQVSEPTARYEDRPANTTSLAAIGAAVAEMRKQYSAS